MQSNPLVTIISPTYGHASVIGECIRSAIAQTYPHWEMIILDDGSVDGTYDAALLVAGNDTRIRVFRQENKGIFRLGENYNFMFERSTGKYITVLEGDDVWEADKLERQVSIMEARPDVVVTWGKANVTQSDIRDVLRVSPADDDVRMSWFNNTPTGSILKALYFDNCIPALTIMFRRTALEKLGGFIQTHGQPLVDLPTLLACAEMGPFHFEPVVLGAWRTYVTQVTKSFPVEIILGRRDCVLDHYRKLAPAIQSNVGLDTREMKAHYDRLLIIGYSRMGRYQLVKKEFTSARKNYLKSVFYPRQGLFMWRLRSLVGLVFSLFHLNVEGLAGSMGKTTYKV